MRIDLRDKYWDLTSSGRFYMNAGSLDMNA